MKKIALATSFELSSLTDDDRLFFKILSENGLKILPVVWDDSKVEWEDFDLVIIRSCWDYVSKIQTFINWLNLLELKKVFVKNDIKTLKQNIDKNYLRDLKQKGINIIPTIFVSKDQKINLSEIFANEDWKKVVIKPCISATGYNTFVIDKNKIDFGQSVIEKIQLESGVLIQKYMDEINSIGEWSFAFFNGEYSHAVIKKTSKDDFRVQEKFGGKTQKGYPSVNLIEQAKEIISKTAENCLYARVDGVEQNGKLLLMELELTEPSLYLEYDDNAPELFAKEIISIL